MKPAPSPSIGRWLLTWSSVATLGILVVAGVSGGFGLVLHLVVTDARGTPTPEGCAW